MWHQRTHTEKPYQCDVCNENFTVKGDLVRHQRTDFNLNLRSRPLIYSGLLISYILFLTFTYLLFSIHILLYLNKMANVDMHMEIHSGEKPFECSHCEKTFSHKDNLDVHMQIHSNDKPFECIQCGKTFSSKSKLNRHMMMHSGDKPFECTK